MLFAGFIALPISAQQQAQTNQSSRNELLAAESQAAVIGCLQGSDGHYTLTDVAGRTYELQGDMSKLTSHIGHEVRITTTTPASIATSSGLGSDATGNQQPTLAIKDVSHVSATCQEPG